MSTSFKPIDPKRDEFRRYLERSSVIEALTKAFVRILRDRPENALEYLKTHLGDSIQENDNILFLKNELKDAHAEIERLRSIINTIDPTILENSKEEENIKSSPVDPIKTEHEVNITPETKTIIPLQVESIPKEDKKEEPITEKPIQAELNNSITENSDVDAIAPS